MVGQTLPLERGGFGLVTGPDCPLPNTTWYWAAWYCNYLSYKEASPGAGGVILANDAKQYAEGMNPLPDFLKLHRLLAANRGGLEYACLRRCNHQPVLRGDRGKNRNCG